VAHESLLGSGEHKGADSIVAHGSVAHHQCPPANQSAMDTVRFRIFFEGLLLLGTGLTRSLADRFEHRGPNELARRDPLALGCL